MYVHIADLCVLYIFINFCADAKGRKNRFRQNGKGIYDALVTKLALTLDIKLNARVNPGLRASAIYKLPTHPLAYTHPSLLFYPIHDLPKVAGSAQVRPCRRKCVPTVRHHDKVHDYYFPIKKKIKRRERRKYQERNNTIV